MENLLIESDIKVQEVDKSFQRYLMQKINWDAQLIAIKGFRGVGKTTMLLQYMKINNYSAPEALYVSLEHQFFYDNKLIDLADDFSKSGGKFLFLDEVHKYPNWSREIKLIYDNYPNLKTVFTSSSILDIYKGDGDLSRRATDYLLWNMSFREFIEFETGIKIDTYSLEDILNNHKDISNEIRQKIKPIKDFKNYLKFGAYPFYKKNKSDYFNRLNRVINLIIEVDINIFYNPDYSMIFKTKRLLNTIVNSAPFIPNITKISQRIGVSRQTVLKTLTYLEKALLIIQATKPNKGISSLSKPDKLYVNNSNIMYALAGDSLNIGSLRESFFINQLSNTEKVNISNEVDFIVNDKYNFEVGGKNKSKKQLIDIDNSYLIKDDIENGYGNIIPLWLFGFLY